MANGLAASHGRADTAATRRPATMVLMLTMLEAVYLEKDFCSSFQEYRYEERILCTWTMLYQKRCME